MPKLRVGGVTIEQLVDPWQLGAKEGMSASLEHLDEYGPEERLSQNASLDIDLVAWTNRYGVANQYLRQFLDAYIHHAISSAAAPRSAAPRQ